MKKKTILIMCGILLFTLIISILLLKKETYYTVSFNTNGGNSIENIKVLKGSIIDDLKIPTKEGFIFDYWLYNNEKFNINTKIAKDITLEAKWSIDTKEYYCDKGYTLNKNKCEKKEYKNGSKIESCPENYTEINKKCLNLNDVKDIKYSCPNNGVHLEGKKCLYGFLEEYPDKTSCENRGHTYKNGKCYQATIELGTASCDNKYIMHEGKCVKTTSKITTVSCPDNYIKEENKCYKIISIDAKEK